MTTIPGVDYAWSHPSAASLKAAGKKFAARYLSHDTSKNLSATEARALAAAGISCVVVWESTAKRPLAGRTAGAADARDGLAQARAAGMPASRPIYFAVDWDATPGQQDEINAYLDGAASVLGKDRVGIYGGYYPVKRALDSGHAKWAWQTIAWSGGQWDHRAHIRQGTQVRIGGVTVDLDTAYAADYGQWMPGRSPVEDPMAGMTKQDIFDAVWKTDAVPAPDTSTTKKTNPTWAAVSVLRDIDNVVRSMKTTLEAQGAVIKTMADALAAGGPIDPDALVARITEAIENVTVHLDVDSPTS